MFHCLHLGVHEFDRLTYVFFGLCLCRHVIVVSKDGVKLVNLLLWSYCQTFLFYWRFFTGIVGGGGGNGNGMDSIVSSEWRIGVNRVDDIACLGSGCHPQIPVGVLWVLVIHGGVVETFVKVVYNQMWESNDISNGL